MTIPAVSSPSSGSSGLVEGLVTKPIKDGVHAARFVLLDIRRHTHACQLNYYAPPF